MDVQEVIDLLIKLKGKEEIKETNQALEETAKDLEKVEKKAEEAGDAMGEAAKKSKEFGSKIAEALKQIASDSLDEESGLPSAEKAVKAVSTALDGLIAAAPAAATAIGGPIAGMIAGQLTGTITSLKDSMIEYAASLVHVETEEEAAIRRQKEYAEAIGKTVEEVQALEKAEEERKKRQESDAKKLAGIADKESDQKSKEAADRVNESVKAVGGKQAIDDVADALFKIKAAVQLKAEARGDVQPEDWAAMRKQIEDEARRQAASLIEIARGGRGTPEQQADAQRKLDALMNNGQAPEFRLSPLGVQLQNPTKQEMQDRIKEAKEKDEEQKKADKEAADKAKADVKTDLKIAAMEFKEFMATLKEQGEAYKQEEREKAKAKREQEKEDADKERERQRAERETDQAAKNIAKERPDLVLEAQQALYNNGNSARAQRNVSQELQRRGMDADVANRFTFNQSADLQSKFESALNVTGDTNSANIAIQRQLQEQYEKLVQQTLDLQRQQMELMQRMGAFGPTLQNQGR